MTVYDVLLTNLTIVLVAMSGLWVLSLRLRDVSIVDVWWGLGFVTIAWLSFATAGGSGLRPWVLAIGTTLWGTRLAIHLARRNLGKPEDPRYRAMREHHGRRFAWLSLVIVFGLQGVLMWVVSLPLQLGSMSAAPLNAWDAIGATVWGIGFAFESVGDWQLTRFRGRPENAGRVLDTGLWRYTRHPNYFGDCLVWWGMSLIGVAGDQRWWLLFSPLIMTWLLVRVSGVALLEKDIAQRRPEYAAYVRRTSAFLPLPPRPPQAH